MGEKPRRTPSLEKASLTATIAQHNILMIELFGEPLTPSTYKMNV